MSYVVAVVPGDGIGPEVCEAALTVMSAAMQDPDQLRVNRYEAGAGTFLEKGSAFPEEVFDACKKADAIFHGAAGLPNVTFDDGTEAGLDFGLELRFKLDLFANVRPVKLHPGIPGQLKGDPQIDYVIVRENTEGFYAGRGGGNIVRDDTASDTSILTRNGVERVARKAFELARQRSGAPRDGVRRVTVCDKANVLRSFAFFRRIVEEVSNDFPDVELDYALVDAMTVHLIKNPDFYDVIVTENMFGDIISDLGAATVGGMGMSPTAEIGHEHGFFQAAHGSAPDIAGQGIANPIGTILSGSMMLEWLSEKHRDNNLLAAAANIKTAVSKVLEQKGLIPIDAGGTAGTREIVDEIMTELGRLKN